MGELRPALEDRDIGMHTFFDEFEPLSEHP